MYNLLLFLSQQFIQLLRNIWGSIHKPYTTYRAVTSEDPIQLVFIFIFIGMYFFFISPLKLHTLHPFFLTINTYRLFTVTLTSYLLICGLFMLLGKLFKSSVSLRGINLAWGYSLIPTLIWFFTTSLFYLLLPPPRHETLLGRSFSVFFITFSIFLLYWKGLLYYLTMRFALKFDMKKIIVASAVFFPLLGLYSWSLYRLDIFRVPFI